MPNHLQLETSPYLLQHKDNPVQWYPWCPEALAQAEREDKPILLSIGYSSCHWCHVMAHESFEDPEVASVMNRLFVNIKVDREERPDLDHIYQTAQQMLTGRAGGWPLTMFLTPDRVPFFGGTYFPTEPRFGLPGFVQVLENVALAFGERKADITAQNASLLDALSGSEPAGDWSLSLDAAVIGRAVADIKAGFDAIHGGYGGAPKFPRPAELEFLLHRGDGEAREQALITLRKMAEGGLFDHIGGGFYRYSVDERWAIPHFEKMLYDNGPLLGLYADASAATGEPLFARTAERLVAWLDREMSSPEGVFYAALDADSEHEEGRFYLWRPEEVQRLLAEQDRAVATAYWGLDGRANFEGRTWHLLQAQPLDQVAGMLGITLEEADARLESARLALSEARQSRVRPARDDKILTSWNALVIRGLARAARRMRRPAWAARATRSLDALRRLVWRDGRLLATYKDGQARHNAYLDDYALLLDALLEMMRTEFRPCDLDWAISLADSLLADFEDADRGGFFFTRHDHEALIHRSKPAHDSATPSGNGVAALVLARLGHLLGEARYLRSSERALRLFYPHLNLQPAGFPTLLAALAEFASPPRIVVLRGPDLEVGKWLDTLNPHCPADTLIIAPGDGTKDLPPMLDQPSGNRVRAYACTGVKCLPAIVQMSDLAAFLSG